MYQVTMSIIYLIHISLFIVVIESLVLKTDIEKARKIKALISRQQELFPNINQSIKAKAFRNGIPKKSYPELGRSIQLRRQIVDIDDEYKQNKTLISSSVDLPFWRDEWQKFFDKRKKEAKDLYNPKEHDASVNMVAARPFGVQCGDPDQYAVLWGNCMLSAHCAADLRIWRGDHFCGRTELVCCAMQINAYDTIQGLPPSFEDTDMGFESSEYVATSLETRARHAHQTKDKYKNHRIVRKERLKSAVKNIANKMKRMLKSAYHKITDKKAKQTLLLRKYIKWLKRMHKKDRLSARDLHELEMIKLDKGLLQKINQLMGINKFANKNDTFREITYNATITHKMAKLLLRFFPEVKTGFNNMTRRNGLPITPDNSTESYGLEDLFGDVNNETGNQTQKDVEYGLLYF